MVVRKVSLAATKDALRILTNVKDGNVLGITLFAWCFILSQGKFSPQLLACGSGNTDTIMRYCFFIQYFLLANFGAKSRINRLPVYPSPGCRS
jgi:formate/nitrite transporter FocA (FNT family)